MKRLATALPALIPTAVLCASALVPPGWEAPFPLCAVKAIAGVDCPGCGMTRAFLLIGHGRIAEGFAMHPAAPLAFLVTAGFAVAGIARGLHGGPRTESDGAPGGYGKRART